ncbi:ATP-dependent protease ATPase subunit HslU [Candidatus Sumerlaeota bacterium]|nr:ATP-dependent protease ATPase subunit HslU [Candidatus Sumerlaeota bacterium]
MEAQQPVIEGLTPHEIVAELDKFIIGQHRAKKMVAIALRNRARRKLIAEDLRDEVTPKNILMIGPTGVGKTEISRRLARLAGAPFLKVEASKYTEVGYVGRDVESMVRDLVDIGVKMVREERTAEILERATETANERLLDLLLPRPVSPAAAVSPSPFGFPGAESAPAQSESSDSDDARGGMSEERWERTREKLRKGLVSGAFEDREVDVHVRSRGGLQGNVIGFGLGNEAEMMGQLQQMIERMAPQKPQEKRLPIRHARQILVDEEVDRLLDMDKVVAEALDRVQQSGIVFIDEIDKIAGRGSGGYGPDVSREGVQRDILPLIEGSTVATKYGVVSTEHVLFVASGAFHISKPSDLIPELQGRFPLRVELESLTAEDFRRILVEPDNALTKQYQALMETEEVRVVFAEDGIDQLASCAYQVNQQTENIGARRLHTVIEKVFEDVSFNANRMRGQTVVVDSKYVNERLADIVRNEDLSKFIL